MPTLNEVYSALSVRRRYEVWFLRMGLADGSGAWWFRYLLMNPGRHGCAETPGGAPVQVWATWFPREEKPQNFIQGFPLQSLNISESRRSPFHFAAEQNKIDEGSCRGVLNVDGHAISWDLRCSSTFRNTLSNKGWIGFSRTPHSDAVFSGRIVLDGRIFAGDPLAFGLQGHNCGYRHRGHWVWSHAFFPRPSGTPTTLEVLVYDMPFGLVFRKAVLWHEGRAHVFRHFREETVQREFMHWKFRASDKTGMRITVEIDGGGISTHRLPYVKTNCSGSFEVSNNSLASAAILIESPKHPAERLETATGAVLEMAGDYPHH